MKNILSVLCAFVALSSTADAQPGQIRRVRNPVAGQYIVMLRANADAVGMALESLNVRGGRLKHVYRSALNGFAMQMPAAAAAALARDPRVAVVEEDGIAVGAAAQTAPPWGLDRIDQRARPLDTTYTYEGRGHGVNVYVLDSGIRTTHQEFIGRAFIAGDFVDDDADGDPADVGNDDSDPSTPDGADCHGHGTHVSGTVGGETAGVAKDVTLWALRVLNCSNTGSWSGIIAAIDWVTANHRAPAVANMSIQGGASSLVDEAVRRSIAAGVTYVIAAGNSNADAATSTPARVGEAITVAATDDSDTRASFSNYGPLLDLFAPGVSIRSSLHTSDQAYGTWSGTSMAAPHVAGVAALFLADNPGATPQAVRDALVGAATTGVVQSPGTGSPNLLLYSGFLVAPAPTPPSVRVVSPNGGERLTAGTPYTVQWTASDADGLASFEVQASSDGINFTSIAGCAALDGARRSCTWSAPGPPTSAGRIRVVAWDALGASAFDTSDAAFTIVPATTAPGPLPAPWRSADVGAVSAAGSAGYSNGTFTVRGSGADIWGRADELHYASRLFTGDFTIEARVTTVQAVHAWTKAGLMIREGTAAGARHASLFATPSTQKGVSFQRRTTANGTSVATAGPLLAPPVWLRLTRDGNVVTAHYRSTAGSSWRLVGQQSFTALAATVEVGFAVSSHVDGTVASATFDGVAIRNAAPADSYASADIGNVGVAGTTSVSGGTVTIEGAGADIWGTADAFRYYYRPWTGDGTITVRVQSVENVAAWTKAGVMFRETLAANSAHVMLLVSPGKGVSMQYRATTGGTSAEAVRAAGTAPEWLRLARAGNTFTASASEDGATWRTLASRTVTAGASLYVGLPVGSHSTATLATAVFTNLTVEP